MFTTFAAEPLWRAGTPTVAPPPRHRGAPRATSAQLPGARACRGDRARETPRRDQAGRRSRNEPPGDLRRTGEPGGRDLPRDGRTHREGQLVAGFHPLKTRMTRWIRRLDRRRQGVKMPADGARADQIRSADSRCADRRVSGLSCRRREGRFADTPCTDRRLRAASAARLRVEACRGGSRTPKRPRPPPDRLLHRRQRRLRARRRSQRTQGLLSARAATRTLSDPGGRGGTRRRGRARRPAVGARRHECRPVASRSDPEDDSKPAPAADRRS
jgi:hypothetical protein